MRVLPAATAVLLGGGLLLAGYGAAGYVATSPAKDVARAALRARAAAPHPQVRRITMTIVTGTKAHPDWPAFTNAYWHARVGDVVVLTIRSYDDGTAPVNETYAQVRGTVGGVVRVDGKAVRAVPAQDVAHTFTVPALGINIPIPAAPHGGSVTVEAVLHVTKAGTFGWQCYAPCGTGTTGWGGPMVTPGYMEGAVTVSL